MNRRGILLALGAVTLGGCISAFDDIPDSREADEGGGITFRDATEDSGFDYAYAETGRDLEKISNAGVFVSDYNNDGFDDVLAIGGSEPILFENHGGDFRESENLPTLDINPFSALFFDYNNNGWEDLLLLPMREEAVFLENQQGMFVVHDVGLEVAFEAPIGAAAADATGNGLPDVFVIQNGDWNQSLPRGYRTIDVDGDDNGHRNLLFENSGEGFTDITDEAGIHGKRWSLATSFLDVTGDGRPDIHVANDFSRDVLYFNEGRARFRREVLGEATDRNGMSSEVGDFTGDGRPDIFVTNIYYPEEIRTLLGGTLEERAAGNNLLRNEGNGSFEDIAEVSGVHAGGWGWASVATDFDNDGRVDLIHGTTRDDLTSYGLDAASREEILDMYPFYRYPAAWKGTDEGFDRLRPDSLGIPQLDSRGLASLDTTNTGTIDLVVADATGDYRLLEYIGDAGNAIQLMPRADGDGTALGATVEVTAGEIRQWKVADSRTDYVSQRSRMLHFGVGTNASVHIEIQWPDGRKDRYEDVETEQRLVVAPQKIMKTVTLT